MNNTESFLIVDDLVGLNKVIDFEKMAKLASEYNQTDAHQQNARIYSFSTTFNLEETRKKCRPFWEMITSNDEVKSMTRQKYIVTEDQILDTVESALNEHISNNLIVRELMETIENNVQTVLEDDCEEFNDEDYEYIGD